MTDPATPLAILARAVATRPDAVALVAGEVRLTYAEYARAVTGLAALLDCAGRPVALLLRNGIEICVAGFAVQAAGGIAAALNPDYTPRELRAMLADADPAVVIAHADLIQRVREAGYAGRLLRFPNDHPALDLGSGLLRDLAESNLIPSQAGDAGDALSLAALIATGTTALPAPDPSALAVLQFTGGSTGRAKGVMLNGGAVAANVAQREGVLPTVWGDERIVAIMPLFHSFAAAMCLHLAANAAGTLHILPRYRPDWLVDCIEAERITRLPAGPTVFSSLLGYDRLDRAALASLRCAYSGSAPLAAATLARWEAATGVAIYEGYGQSEAGPVLTYQGPATARKLGSVGPPLPGTEIEIVDVADGITPAQVGEIRARGPQLMAGYLGDPVATADALRDGWLYTGDIGHLDGDGHLFIDDRKKDMAIVGGYNVFPREIDEVLAACPGVVEAAAVAVPDAYRGEVIRAFVVGADVAAVQAHCAANLVRYKQPARIEIVAALPRTSVGKVDKPALRAMP